MFALVKRNIKIYFSSIPGVIMSLFGGVNCVFYIHWIFTEKFGKFLVSNRKCKANT